MCVCACAGVLTLTKWCESMEAATKLGLPWRLLREKLAPPDADQPTTDVTYRRTLDMLEDDLIVSVARVGVHDVRGRRAGADASCAAS